MSKFIKRFKQLRKQKGVTQSQIAKSLNVTQTAITYWETGKREPNNDIIELLAKYFDVSPAYLMGWDEEEKPAAKPKSKGVKIPVLGRVAAGIPINAVEEIIDTEEITEELAKTGEFFGLQIRGDSMEPRMCSGDVVIVRQQEDAESGDIVIVSVNGTDATCKRLRKYRDGIELISTNPSYEPIFFSNEDIAKQPIKILGKVIELRAKFK